MKIVRGPLKVSETRLENGCCVPAKETPATRVAREAGVPFELHEYEHDPRADSYALEAAEALGLEPDRVLKTLVVARDGDLAVCIVPAAEKLHLQALGKRSAMAPPDRAEKVTGYVAGGISPLGQRRRLPTFVDEWALVHDTVFVSAGRRGLEIELAPDDLVALTGAEVKALT
jgi:Cys-tRNA(Pro)/Cys-tRNA(Cys) deacylase